MRRITTIILHHSAARTNVDPGTIADWQEAKGLSRPGAYHYYLWEQGIGAWRVDPMRPEARIGAHDQGQNATSIGICVAGDYTTRALAPAAFNLLVDLITDCCLRYGLSAEAIEGHREHEPPTTPTICPGYEVAPIKAAVEGNLRRIA